MIGISKLAIEPTVLAVKPSTARDLCDIACDTCGPEEIEVAKILNLIHGADQRGVRVKGVGRHKIGPLESEKSTAREAVRIDSLVLVDDSKSGLLVVSVQFEG